MTRAEEAINNSIDLHELANRPGYGSARKALRKTGFWQETYDEMPLWTVRIEATCRFTTCAIIAAPNKDSARHAAERMDPNDLDFDNGRNLEIEMVGNASPRQDYDWEPDVIVGKGRE